MTDQHSQPQAQDKLALILGLQKEARGAEGLNGFGFIMVNRIQRLLPCHMAAFWIEGTAGIQVISVSGVPTPEQDAPFILWVKALVASACKSGEAQRAMAVDASMFAGNAADDWARWSPPYMLWLPLTHPNSTELIGGLVLSRDQAWQKGELLLGETLVGAFAETLLRFKPGNRLISSWLGKSKVRLALFSLMACLLLVPVRQSVVAPAEIVPGSPIVLAAPRDGVITSFHVAPNQSVNEGDLLFTLDDTELKAKYEVSIKELAVAVAEYQKTSYSAFENTQSKAELGVVESRIAKAKVQAEQAASLLERGNVRALKSGIAVYSDPTDWIGKPVRTGERIITLADPAKVEIHAWVPVADAIVLESGADAKMFLNISPLTPISAKITGAAYEAKLTPERILAYRVKAGLADGENAPRIGLKGTAKLYGSHVPFIYYLLRRPISVMRQWIGF
jgi:hypothetical protein